MLRCDPPRIEAGPKDAYPYSSRAQYYGYLGDRAQAATDMKQWSAIMGTGVASDVPLATPRAVRRVISGPFGYQLVFSVEERENDMQVPCIALGQKGRCNVKSFQIPMLSISLLGLCLLSGLDSTPAYADFTFGEPEKVSGLRYNEWINCFSYDGLELDSDTAGITGTEDISY